MTLTLKKFREMTADLPEDTPIYYHASWHGFPCMNSYRIDDLRVIPNEVGMPDEVTGIVLNPRVDFALNKARTI